MKDTSGFYKSDAGELLFGPNFVYGPYFTLIREDKDELIALNVFPIEGWSWFDTEDEARVALNLPKPVEENV